MIPFDTPVFLWRLAGYAVAVGLVGSAVGRWNHHERDVGRAEIRAEWTAEKLAQAQADTAAAQEAQRLSARAFTRTQEVSDDHAARARTTAVALDALRLDLGSVHDAATAAQRAAEDAEPACPTHAAAVAEFRTVVDECTQRRTEVAGVAAGYADTLGSLQRWVGGVCTDSVEKAPSAPDLAPSRGSPDK